MRKPTATATSTTAIYSTSRTATYKQETNR
jgi:hypothetical protein